MNVTYRPGDRSSGPGADGYETPYVRGLTVCEG
jgi:hypothetical protein